ncbi:hypothetical protein PHJA_001326300 [Phtheirospermum japonicum]|uniref:S-protein homolog n=1 Tax=Phtheirospermum japonicum TaxID=374723 RepID=A0A830C6W6_9LAMI|nr:hypothetical protein PHJA_001326300 [Phtheirospermum japonicum]
MENRKCWITPKVIVHVANKLSPNSELLLHCSSKDDDLGIQTLRVNQEFGWSFCDNVFETTTFHCDLRTGQKQKRISAYKSIERESCRHNICYWEARDDGIYFFEYKYYDWDHVSTAQLDIIYV